MKKIKRILSGMLICSFTLSNIPYYCNVNSIKHKNKSIVKAADLVSPDGYSYTTTNDGVVITGYSGKETDLKIPSTIDSKDVIEIGDKAFYKIGTLKSIDIPNTVKTIGGSAFAGCNNLSTVKLNEGLDRIDSLAFFDTAITEITIPASVESARNAFGSSASFYSPDYSNTKLKSVTFSEGATVVPESIFSDCIALTDVNLPNGITKIESYAFASCKALTDFATPNSVVTIEYSAFADCENLSTVKLNEGLKEIHSATFNNTAITEITIPSTVERAGNAFGYWEGENTKLTSASFAEGTEIIPENIFEYCTSLKTVHFPDTLKDIGNYAFSHCTNLSSITGGKDTISFHPYTFDGCESLFDKRFTLVDPSSYIQANADVASVNGIVNYTVRYQLKDNVAANSSNHCLHLDIPEGMTIIPDSMVSNVSDVSEIDYGSNSFEVNNTKGIVKFSCRILEYGDYNVGAYLSFDYNNDYWEQSVGTLEVDVPKITCSSIETTNQYNIDVHGIAEKGKNIDIYVDGKKNTTIKNNEHTGKYTVNITLPEKKSGESYNIYAQSGQLVSD